MNNEILNQLANQFGTPLYVYDNEKIETQYKRLTQAFSKVERFKVYYAVKALSNISIFHSGVKLFQNFGNSLYSPFLSV